MVEEFGATATEQACAAPGERVAHLGQHVGRIGDLLVAQDEPGALTHHVPAKVEHPAVAADEGLSLP